MSGMRVALAEGIVKKEEKSQKDKEHLSEKRKQRDKLPRFFPEEQIKWRNVGKI